MAKNDTTPTRLAPCKHVQNPKRSRRVSIIRTPDAGIYVYHPKGAILSRKLEKISTARRVLGRIQRGVPDAYLAVHESFVGALDAPLKTD